ncbi:PREDICTED: linoleate 9S-lipoxygenase 2-like [Nelumbo nucifera]|uniref:Lipoxygenase n=2 Tax=Nelumbo nucifera TaxID=4432 RepID=A0A822XYY5_NELNU|nr:PREDICTED: linoleate 9S-lipoxygenase 2-like [Nelumbo nucifera]DAD25232.1 TPA_asm: hypothetical protein HUJ06_026696 [Nelumbo nucifera]
MGQGWFASLSKYVSSSHAAQSPAFKGTFVISQIVGRCCPGKSASVQLYSATKFDPNTGKGKLSEKAHLKHGKKTQHNGEKTITYSTSFEVPPEFGVPGAFLIQNPNNHEFFLMFATLQLSDNQIVHFECNSWVYPNSKTKADRLFFSNTSYLPSLTPEALKKLREEELASLRGDGAGERKEWDRIYDYDCYNDLGNPDKGLEYERPVLGGSKAYPYPRRGRTGRPPSKQDPLTESRPELRGLLDVYVPPDERFSPRKMSEFIGNSIQAIVNFILPEAKNLFHQDFGSFESFAQLMDLYSSNRHLLVEGWVKEGMKTLLPQDFVKEINHASKENPRKFPLPQIIQGNQLAWMDDAEFAREMLAGVNASLIQCMWNFPRGYGSGYIYSIKTSDIKETQLDGLTLEAARLQGRLFILDHHDYLMPFLTRIINSEGVSVYASRTLLFRSNDDTLKPLAIELSLPGCSSRVLFPATMGTEAALWQFARAHVAVNDSVHHHLISHWLKTHAIIEPFIIATRRQLSEMHPVHRLLHPHFKDTMHTNALARSILINAGGILEKTMYTGKISMELSSAIYRNWNFREQALPVDLVKRGLACEDPDHPYGVRLLFEDYPFGVDGLEIWAAVKTWVMDFCSIFYSSDEDVLSDVEIQAWWSEIRDVGHGDKRNETWWYKMDNLSDLVETLTTLIWIASALHASVNFGQYDYGGYPPNRPTLCQKFIPEEGTFEYAEFLKNPDKYFLKMLPERFEMTVGVALMEVLSRHTSDEAYLGQGRSLEWTDSGEIRQRFETFRQHLQEAEKRILERNKNPNLKNRIGPAKIPYTLLYPDTLNMGSTWGITGKGIPNSVSI